MGMYDFYLGRYVCADGVFFQFPIYVIFAGMPL